MKRLHKILKEKRELKGYSQEYVAEKMQVSTSTISRWESRSVDMTLGQLHAYALVLEMDAYDLFAAYAKMNRQKLMPIVQVEIEIFNKLTYHKIMDNLKNLDPQDCSIRTKSF